LKNYGIEYIDVPFGDYKIKGYPHHAVGCYLNFLEIGDLIVIPRFEIEKEKDEEVFQLFQKLFPERKIESVNFNEVGYYGGLLNCSTWTIKEQT
jgi:agmatine deiminase